MKVIILKKSFLGDIGSVLDVKSGYARNYLVPYGEAIYATEDNVNNFNKKELYVVDELKLKNKEYEKLSKKIFCLSPLVVKSRCRKNGKLFGSINVVSICKIFSEKLGFNVPKRCITLSSKCFKYLGVYDLKIIINKVNVIDFVLKILPLNV